MVPGLARASRLWMNNRITGAPASFSYVYYPWAASLGGTGS
jgi:peptide/nickel transport system substrate-binding protein